MSEKKRKCLKCGKRFLSEGVHNRICDPCDYVNTNKTRSEIHHKMNHEHIIKQEEKHNKESNKNT